jgi:hypothetical protein
MISAKMDNIESAILKKAGIIWSQIRICELGNQLNLVRNKPAKEVYLERGVIEHISMDLNQRDGSLLVDLNEPVEGRFHGGFHIVTNYGTSEHVLNQYQVFKNINDMCALGGIIIHALVLPGNWPEHCRYYYASDFAQKLADLCGYVIIHSEIMSPHDIFVPYRDVNFVVFVKNADCFVDEATFKQLPIIDTGDNRKMGNYYEVAS